MNRSVGECRVHNLLNEGSLVKCCVCCGWSSAYECSAFSVSRVMLGKFFRQSFYWMVSVGLMDYSDSVEWMV